MNQAPVRQLSAIMFADIVGYTAMMQRSEADAVASRDRFREVLTDLVPHHHGTVVQHYGDGTLTIFPSAVEATSCALMIQRSMTAEPHVPLRIGLHVGDIVRDHEGVYGDGVNLAARVQALAVAGSVFVTERVAEEVKNHGDLSLIHLGEYRLKNVLQAVGVFAVAHDDIVVPTARDIEAEAPAERSVAVLPFLNMSGDPTKEFFSDGISEEIINALAQLPGLKVTSRTSTFAFKGKDSDVREIARTLDVGHVLEGSVRTSGKRVRVTAQLIDAESGFHVFSENWDRDLEDVFVIQDELSRAIAGHLQTALKGVSSHSPPVTMRQGPDPEAYTPLPRGPTPLELVEPGGSPAEHRAVPRGHRDRSGSSTSACGDRVEPRIPRGGRPTPRNGRLRGGAGRRDARPVPGTRFIRGRGRAGGHGALLRMEPRTSGSTFRASDRAGSGFGDGAPLSRDVLLDPP